MRLAGITTHLDQPQGHAAGTQLLQVLEDRGRPVRHLIRDWDAKFTRKAAMASGTFSLN